MTTWPGGEPRREVLHRRARSRKGAYAEQLLHLREGVTYVATGPAADGSDPEWSACVERHRTRRSQWWTTVETHDLVPAFDGATAPLLIERLGSWLARAATPTEQAPTQADSRAVPKRR